MTDAIDNAAAAFSADMGVRPAPGERAANPQTKKPERMFGDVGELENPDEQAGGDDLPPPKVDKRQREQQIEETDEEDDDAEGPDEGDEEGDEEDGEDGEDADEEDDDDEGDDEDEELLNQKFEVTVDGQPQEVTLREALDGYIRRSTFDQRMGKIGQIQNALRSEAQAVVESRQEYISKLEEASKIIEGIIPAEPDWDKLFAENPQNARQMQKSYDEFKKNVADIRKQHADALAKAKSDKQAEDKRFAESEWPKFAESARWKDKAHMEKDLRSMRQTMLSAGFNDQDVSYVYDSRMLSILLKASKYDRMVANKPKPVNPAKVRKTVNPGTGGGQQRRAAPQGIVKAQQQLSRTGSIDDASLVFDKILSATPRRGPRNRR